MKFEYNPEKSQANQEKHRISFEEIQVLWTVASVDIGAKSADEERFLKIGKLDGKFYSCFFTIRSGAIRLISARRSRKEEEDIYNEKIKTDES